MPNLSPDIKNYYIGKGQVFFKPEGGAYRPMGNCPSYQITPNNTVLDHFSSQGGVKKKDRSVVTETGATLAFDLEEYTLENLRLALLGGEVSSDSTSGPEGDTMEILAATEIRGAIKFIGQNDVGSRFIVELPGVSFTKGAGAQFISDTWGALNLEAELVAVNGSFGTVQLAGVEGSSESESI